jgi:hypothetical protein
LDQLTLEQLNEWKAYDVIDPIGTWRDDFRMAKLAALIENIAYNVYFRAPGEKAKMITPEDEMPNWAGDIKKKKDESNQTVEQMKQALMQISRMHNKNIVKDKIRRSIPPKKKDK